MDCVDQWKCWDRYWHEGGHCTFEGQIRPLTHQISILFAWNETRSRTNPPHEEYILLMGYIVQGHHLSPLSDHPLILRIPLFMKSAPGEMHWKLPLRLFGRWINFLLTPGSRRCVFFQVGLWLEIEGFINLYSSSTIHETMWGWNLLPFKFSTWLNPLFQNHSFFLIPIDLPRTLSLVCSLRWLCAASNFFVWGYRCQLVDHEYHFDTKETVKSLKLLIIRSISKLGICQHWNHHHCWCWNVPCLNNL